MNVPLIFYDYRSPFMCFSRFLTDAKMRPEVVSAARSHVRRVGLVVSTSDSRTGVANLSPDEATTHQTMRNILEQGVHLHVLR